MRLIALLFLFGTQIYCQSSSDKQDYRLIPAVEVGYDHHDSFGIENGYRIGVTVSWMFTKDWGVDVGYDRASYDSAGGANTVLEVDRLSYWRLSANRRVFPFLTLAGGGAYYNYQDVRIPSACADPNGCDNGIKENGIEPFLEARIALSGRFGVRLRFVTSPGDLLVDDQWSLGARLKLPIIRR